jgi:hypothetical protein
MATPATRSSGQVSEWTARASSTGRKPGTATGLDEEVDGTRHHGRARQGARRGGARGSQLVRRQARGQPIERQPDDPEARAVARHRLAGEVVAGLPVGSDDQHFRVARPGGQPRCAGREPRAGVRGHEQSGIAAAASSGGRHVRPL